MAAQEQREPSINSADIEVREDARADVRVAAPAAKPNIIRQYIDRFRDVGASTSPRVMSRLAQALESGRRVGANDAGYIEGRSALFRLFEVVKVAGDVGIAPADIGLRDDAIELIREVDTRVSPFLTDTNDTIQLYNFLKKFIDTDFDENRWRTEWQDLKGKMSNYNLNRVSESIRQTHARTPLKVPATFDVNTEIVVAADEGRQTTSAATETQTNNRTALDRLADDLGIVAGGKDITAYPRPLDKVSQANFMAMDDEVEQKIEAKRQAVADLLNRDPVAGKQESDQFEYYERALQNSRRDGQHEFFKNIINNYFGLNWNDAKSRQYLEYYYVDLVNHRDDKFLSKFGLRQQDFDPIQPQIVLAKWDEYFKNGELTEDAKKRMYSTIYQVTNRLLSRTTSSPDSAEASTLGNERQLDFSLNALIWSLVEDPRIRIRLGEDNYSAYRNFLTNTFMDARNEERKMRRTYTGLVGSMIEGRAKSADAVAGKMSEVQAHEINWVLKGYKSNLTRLAVSEFERDLQHRITVLNGGTLPADLFAANKPDLYSNYQYEDIQRVRDNLKERIRLMQLDPNYRLQLEQSQDGREVLRDLDGIQDWEIDRAMNIAMGVSLVSSMRGWDYMAMSNPRTDFKREIPLIGSFSVKHKARLGRFGEQWHTPEMYELEIRMQEQRKGLWGRVFEGGWEPSRLWGRGKPSERLKTPVLLEKLQESNALRLPQAREDHLFFKDLFKQFSTHSLFTLGGWRIDGLKDWYKSHHGKGMDQNWREAYANLSSEVGTGTRFFYDTFRVSDEIRDILLKKKFGANYKTEVKPSVLDGYWNEFSSVHGREAEKFVFKFNNDDKENNLTTNEFIEEKTFFYRAMNFKAQMDRSPYDFMLNIMQLEPDLAKTYSLSQEVPGLGRNQVTAWEYFFDARVAQSMNAAEKATRADALDKMTQRWTHPSLKSTADNMQHLAKIAEVWHKVYTYQPYMKFDAQRNKYSIDEDGSRRKFYQIITMAGDKVRLEKKAVMNREDIISKKIVKVGDQEQVIDDPDSIFIADVMKGQNGMVTYFDNLNEDFADAPGKESKMGDRKFFYTVAKRWFEYDQRGVLPNTHDVDVLPIFETIGAHEEEAYSRVWGSNKNWNEVTDQLINFDQLLLEAAGSKNMGKIMELHAKVKSLEGSVGVENAQRLNYIIATAVVRYFQLDWRMRFPMPLSIFSGWGLDKEASISVRNSSPSAMQWTEESIRDYMDSLVKGRYLAKGGKWSRDMLEVAVGADRQKYFWLQAGPSIAFLVVGGFLQQVFTTAMKESGLGQKKK